MNAHHKLVEIEKTVVTMIVEDALAAGYFVTLNNGGFDNELEGCQDRDIILAAMFATSDERLSFVDRDNSRVGWVYFVYGNAGWDVMNDWIVNPRMEAILARAEAYSDKIQEAL